ncbi:MAG: glycosyltransferase family 4 protein [Vicinamibacterales bacterium]
MNMLGLDLTGARDVVGGDPSEDVAGTDQSGRHDAHGMMATVARTRPLRVLSISACPFWDVEDRKGMPSIYLGHKVFVDAGHEVTFVHPGRERRIYDYDGIRMHQFRLRFPIVPARHIWLHRLSLKLYYPVFVLRAAIEALRVCRTFAPDVVYGQLFQAVPVAWFIGRVRGVPNITRMYGTFLAPWLHSWKRILRFDEALAFKFPCAYLVMTNDGTRGDECAAALGVPPERLKFWRNGVDKAIRDPQFDRCSFKASLGIPNEHKIALALCRLERWKGVDRLIAALPAVLSQVHDVTVLIVGDGSDRDMLQRMAQESGVAAHVRFVGSVCHEKIGSYLNAADVFVSLYHYSNVGNPLLEALSCGKCVVSIDNGATGKLIENGKTGLLLKEDRLDELPDALVRVLTDDALRKRLSDAALAYASEHFQTWPERLQMEVELVERLVASGSSA